MRLKKGPWRDTTYSCGRENKKVDKECNGGRDTERYKKPVLSIHKEERYIKEKDN